MKPFFCTCLFSCFSVIAISQKVINVGKDDYSAPSLFFSVSGEPVVTARFVKLVEGTPFFKDEWLKSIVTTADGIVYKNVKVKLDLMDGSLHYLDAKGNEFTSITPIKEVVLGDSLQNENFRFINSTSLQLSKQGWYMPLVEEKVSLFKFFDKTLSESKPYGSATTEQKITTKEKYILVFNNQSFYLKNTKDILNVLTDKKQELETFINAQSKNQSLEKRLIETVAYYNSLFDK